MMELTGRQLKGENMDTNITEADIAKLCEINPMAGEQLRRICAERQRDELLIEAEQKELVNGSYVNAQG